MTRLIKNLTILLLFTVVSTATAFGDVGTEFFCGSPVGGFQSPFVEWKLVKWGSLFLSEEHVYIELAKVDGTAGSKYFAIVKKKNPVLYGIVLDFLTGVLTGRYPANTLEVFTDGQVESIPSTSGTISRISGMIMSKMTVNIR